MMPSPTREQPRRVNAHGHAQALLVAVRKQLMGKMSVRVDYRSAELTCLVRIMVLGLQSLMEKPS